MRVVRLARRRRRSRNVDISVVQYSPFPRQKTSPPSLPTYRYESSSRLEHPAPIILDPSPEIRQQSQHFFRVQAARKVTPMACEIPALTTHDRSFPRKSPESPFTRSKGALLPCAFIHFRGVGDRTIVRDGKEQGSAGAFAEVEIGR